MKPKTLERIARIKQEILLGTPYEHIVAMLSNLFGIAPRTMDNLISIANKELAEEAREQREQQKQANAGVYQKEAENINLAMKDIAGCLSRIIRGEEKEQVVMSTGTGPQVVEVKVHTREVLRAINLYCRYAEILGATGEEEEERITGFYIVSKNNVNDVDLEDDDEVDDTDAEKEKPQEETVTAVSPLPVKTAKPEEAVQTLPPEEKKKPKPHRPQEPAHVNARNQLPEPRYYPPGYVKTDVDRWREEIENNRAIFF